MESTSGAEGSSPSRSPHHHHLSRYDSVPDLYQALVNGEEKDVARLFARLDTDHNGSLSPKEFKKFALEFLNVTDSHAPGLEGLVKSLFDEVDADGNGSISKTELEGFLRSSASRYISAPVIKLVDGVAVRVLREAAPFKFEGANLHVLYKHVRNETEKDYPLNAGTAGILHTDCGYAFLFTGTQIFKNDPYEVLLLKVNHHDVKEHDGVISFYLDDNHCVKHHNNHHNHGTPHSMRFEMKVAAGEDPRAVAKMFNAILNGKYDAWRDVTHWWETKKMKSTEEKLDDLIAFVQAMSKEQQELKEEVRQLRQLVGGKHSKDKKK